MGTVSRIWLALAGFLAVAGVVYGLTSHEVAGAPLLLVGGATLAYLGLVLGSEARRAARPGGSEASSEAEAGAGPGAPLEVPHVGPTIWPFGFSIAAVLLAVGFIVSRWILIVGVLAFAVSAAGWLRDVAHGHAHAGDS
jgi:threonine/homoserine/homoserine lactone efflux protein